MFKSFRSGYFSYLVANKPDEFEEKYKIDRSTVLDCYCDMLSLGIAKPGEANPQRIENIVQHFPDINIFYQARPMETITKYLGDPKSPDLKNIIHPKKVSSETDIELNLPQPGKLKSSKSVPPPGLDRMPQLNRTESSTNSRRNDLYSKK